jgi:hypothetical protein
MKRDKKDPLGMNGKTGVVSSFELIVIAFLTSDPCPSPFSFSKDAAESSNGTSKVGS